MAETARARPGGEGRLQGVAQAKAGFMEDDRVGATDLLLAGPGQLRGPQQPHTIYLANQRRIEARQGAGVTHTV